MLEYLIYYHTQVGYPAMIYAVYIACILRFILVVTNYKKDAEKGLLITDIGLAMIIGYFYPIMLPSLGLIGFFSKDKEENINLQKDIKLTMEKDVGVVRN